MKAIALASVLVLLSGGAVAGTEQDTRAVVEQFNAALNARDLKTIASLLTDDSVFENTGPAPDGARYAGKPAVVAFWEKWLAANPDARFEAEEVIVAGDRCIVRWIYRKTRDGKPWHLRGIDVFTVRDGKIAAKLAYVKG
jgi:ketosteroid isomerase-like protein